MKITMMTTTRSDVDDGTNAYSDKVEDNHNHNHVKINKRNIVAARYVVAGWS